MSFRDFIHKPYPEGLGVTFAFIEKNIAGEPKVIAEYDKVMQRGPGNPRIAEQPRNEDGTVGVKDRTLYNIQDTVTAPEAPTASTAAPAQAPQVRTDAAPLAPTGTTIDAGLRRLRKAAEAGRQPGAASP